MHKEQLLEYLKSIRCNSRGKTGTEVATECIKLVEEKFTSTNTGMAAEAAQICPWCNGEGMRMSHSGGPMNCMVCGRTGKLRHA